MRQDKIAMLRHECQKMIERLDNLEAAQKQLGDTGGSLESGAAKRQSMELTRELSRFRRPS